MMAGSATETAIQICHELGSVAL